ncbi:NfeD family protein [Emticicia sp. BO119]|uniref:NfeD family protein n=1 Tax=Emticicia sp. BO119 TaxID=2757768 RepID=UPI0015F0548C|nr:NfeD family protein [Emticicia sp. BO119]MBA4853210.1 NfeD family protein [Emticicia sp. BO119]
MEFFDNLEPLLRTFWYIAIPTSLIFLIQTIMTFAGVDAADGIEADFDGDLGHSHEPFQLFSFRNLINFLLGFSWTGISFYNLVGNRFILAIIAFLIGIAFVAVFFFIIQQIGKLSEDNSFQISNTVNQVGSVYLSIPEHKSGKGKVQISIKGTFHELEAITENGRIKTNETVRIIGIENNTLVVEKI